ncbi:hypothetical protein SK571_02925 [Lentzea sp. BCCO 10_0798]|uniref:Secreted protein n=1 Tax=Lentzea kristufekii TaxID=3095430 RepID=A0ABU4TK32_9PSEU|nr:hypothetical protein [Lentzea sp. BCCO 10_0798]
MTPRLVPAATSITTAAAVVPALLLQLQCTVRRRASGASPPNPWRPEPWQRWLPWWWFR